MTFGTIRQAMGTLATGAFALGIVALVPSVAPAQGSTGARPISLEEAVRLAQQNSPLTVQARNANRTSESAVRASLAQFLPTASFSYTGNQAGGTQFVQGTPVPTTGLPWSYSRSVSSNLTVYDGGQRNFNLRAAQANLESASANEVAQRYSVALTVKTQYFNVLAANEQLAAAKQLLEQAQQQLKVSSAKMAAGVATRADSLTSAIAASLGIGSAKRASTRSRWARLIVRSAAITSRNSLRRSAIVSGDKGAKPRTASSSSRRVTVASYGERYCSSIREPHVVRPSVVQMFSLSATGTPASGPTR